MSKLNYYKLLIVDNDLVAAKEISTYLSNIGYNIIAITTSHNETMQILQTNSVDILLMDIDINGRIDGIESCNIVYREYKIPSIFITSYDDDEVLYLVENSYSYGYLLKPFQFTVLRVMIQLILSKLKQKNRIDKIK